MINIKRTWAIIVAMLLGLAAVFLTNYYFQQQEAALRNKEAEKVRVLVAAGDISRGTTIDYDMLGFKLIPANFIEPGALRSKEAAVGKAALVTIAAGEQILQSKLVVPGTGLTLARKTPPGKRAFTISLDAAASVGGMVQPADHVDVLAVFASPPITLTLFQDILVLAVGQGMVPEEDEKTRERKFGVQATAARSREAITLALTPQQVQVLTVATQQGQIRLTLRPRMETAEALPEVDLSQLPPAVDLNTLLQLYISQFQKQEVAPSVEVIRGLKKETAPLPSGK